VSNNFTYVSCPCLENFLYEWNEYELKFSELQGRGFSSRKTAEVMTQVGETIVGVLGGQREKFLGLVNYNEK